MTLFSAKELREETQQQEGRIEVMKQRLEAKRLANKELKREIQELTEEQSAEAAEAEAEEAEDLVPCILNIPEELVPAALGYLGCKANTRVVATYKEDDYYYGYYLMSPSTKGWFPVSATRSLQPKVEVIEEC